MKTLIIMAVTAISSWSYAWSCALSTYNDPSSVDRCYGRILDHWIHEAKGSIVQIWQLERNKDGGTLSSAGYLWHDNNVSSQILKLSRLMDAKDRLARDGLYQIQPTTLTCESEDDD